MGLYTEFDAVDMGYPNELTGGDESIGEASVLIDYSEACEAFVETFLRVSRELVPVNTGYLKSTIDAGTDGSWCYAEATADYAEYVEYGTSYMDAQPYFEPALEAAMADFHAIAGEAVSFAEEELAQILQDMMSAAMQVAGAGPTGMGGSFMNFLGGLALMTVMFVLFFPVLVLTYGIMDTLSGGSSSSVSGERGSGIPDVIIT